MKKEKDLFNPAFKDLHSMTKDPQKATRKSDGNKSGLRPPSSSRGDGVREETEQDDRQSFLGAMSDVTPLPGERKRIIRYPGANIIPAHPAPDDEQEVMTHLFGLVKGSIDLDIAFSDEYIEGSVRGFSRKLMKQLKRGRFPVQDHIDLHGLTKQEAERDVRDFLVQSHRMGLRCVLIVHGRGLNSPDSLPVLKERLPIWLSSGPAKKIVLAFATARPYDGGTGAIYVLLRGR